MNWPATLSALTAAAKSGSAEAITALSDMLTDCPAEARTAWLREVFTPPAVQFLPGRRLTDEEAETVRRAFEGMVRERPRPATFPSEAFSRGALSVGEALELEDRYP